MTTYSQGLASSSVSYTSSKDYERRTSEEPLIPPPVPRIQGKQGPADLDIIANEFRRLVSDRSSPSSNPDSGRSVLSGRSSGTGSDSSLSTRAYGDKTGTKGFGTGNQYEGADRVNTLAGSSGDSVGMKGFGTGNHYEQSPRRSPRASPAASASSLRSNVSRSSKGNRLTAPETQHSPDKKRNKLGNKLLGENSGSLIVSC